MMKEAAEQFDELCQIKDIEERVNIASAKFSEGQLSAKAMRMLWNILDSKMKVKLLDDLYKKDVRKDNMRRLPIEMLAPKATYVETSDETKVCGTLLKYYLTNIYENIKTQDKFMKLNKALDKYKKEPLIIINTNPKNLSLVREANEIGVKGFIDELIQSNKERDVSSLNLPTAMTIGVELEFTGVDQDGLRNLAYKLEAYGVNYFDTFKIKGDSSVKKNGKKRC